MKKRAKIITTIASLCLAVALLAFGVYAAANVTLNVTSKVKFIVTDVFVDIAGNVYKSNDASGTTQTSLLSSAYTAATYTGDAGSRAPMDTVGSAGSISWSVNGGTVMQLTSAQPWVRYVISFKNVEGHAITVAAEEANTTSNYATAANNMTRGTLSYLTDETTPRSNSNSTGAELTCDNLAVDKTVTFTYTAQVTNVAADAADFNINLTFTITQYQA